MGDLLRSGTAGRWDRGTELAGLTLVLGVLACAPSQSETALRGTMLPEPTDKPSFILTNTNGQPFDFVRDTEGHVTLLFFGYTNCPDICPVHMANLGAVLKRLVPVVSNRIRVVFVTTDPKRDTPERIRRWLDGFDRGFIGLSGPLDSVNAIQERLGLPRALPLGDGDAYAVGHAAHVLAFTTDNRAHIVYPFGTRQEDWAHDLPLLVQGKW